MVAIDVRGVRELDHLRAERLPRAQSPSESIGAAAVGSMASEVTPFSSATPIWMGRSGMTFTWLEEFVQPGREFDGPLGCPLGRESSSQAERSVAISRPVNWGDQRLVRLANQNSRGAPRHVAKPASAAL